MWSRKRLDIGWADIGVGTLRVFFPPRRSRAVQAIEALFGHPDHTLACLSVRTGFDLLLGALALPAGSEVLVSAMTIPDMVRIIESHKLVPVPVDLDPRTMAPSAENWRQAVTPAAKLLVIAHLFGSRVDMAPVVELARRHGLFVVEDCAQAFAGSDYAGDSEADASTFSFGTIKCSMALGGAAMRVRNGDLLRKMRTAQAAYPEQSRWAYQRRLVKCAILKALAGRRLFGLVVRVCRMLGLDYDRRINHAVRGFAGSDFFQRIRRRPSAPLLSMLARRLRNYDGDRWAKHAAKGRTMATALQSRVACPTAATTPHTYWVFPIIVADPTQLIAHLAKAGFDATQGHSLCVVPAPPGRAQSVTAESLLTKLVFLPFYPELPEREAERLVATVLKFVESDAEPNYGGLLPPIPRN